MFKKILDILAYLALVCVLIQAGWWGFGYIKTSSSRSVGNNFVAALQSDDASTAYGLFDEALKAKITEEQFAVLNDQVELKQFKTVDWKGWEVTGPKTRITGEVHSDKGFSTELILELVTHEESESPTIFSFEFKPRAVPQAEE